MELEPLLLDLFDVGVRLARGTGVGVRINDVTPVTVRGDALALSAVVSVGLDVPMVGKLPDPTRYRLRCSHDRWSGSVTDVSGESPITWVPAKWPMPW